MDDVLVKRLFREAEAGRWEVPPAFFADALDRSAAKALAGRAPSAADLHRYLGSLHLADLALACGCALGHDKAWDHFVTEFRPVLHRSADALELLPGNARPSGAERHPHTKFPHSLSGPRPHQVAEVRRRHDQDPAGEGAEQGDHRKNVAPL